MEYMEQNLMNLKFEKYNTFIWLNGLSLLKKFSI